MQKETYLQNKFFLSTRFAVKAYETAQKALDLQNKFTETNRQILSFYQICLFPLHSTAVRFATKLLHDLSVDIKATGNKVKSSNNKKQKQIA